MRVGLVVLLVAWPQAGAELRVDLIGNAGVVLSDGSTSLLVDLPYESGAFGYMTYAAAALRPSGSVVSVITHAHRDHFDPAAFLARDSWQIIGPPSVVNDLPTARVLQSDSLQVGRFTVVAISTPHTDDHRSYRVSWSGREIYFVGDTEDPGTVPSELRLDLLFITPWLSCLLADSGRNAFAARSVLYHQNPDGSDRVCGPVEILDQGASFTLTASPDG